MDCHACPTPHSLCPLEAPCLGCRLCPTFLNKQVERERQVIARAKALCPCGLLAGEHAHHEALEIRARDTEDA